MTDAEFNTIAHFFATELKRRTPKDTGNLAFNATRIQSFDANFFRIYVETHGDHAPQSHDGIAPYFVFVNNRENITLRNGSMKKNKNYRYFQNAMSQGIKDLLILLDATLEEA